MKDLTFIIPVHEYNKAYLDRALNSVSQFTSCKVSIAGPSSVLADIKNGSSEVLNTINNLTLVENNGDTFGFCENVNTGVYNCSTKYFCILEYDDVITPTWVKNVEEHSNAYNDVSAFLPIIEMVKDNQPDSISLANELSWTSSFVEELGYLDMEALKSYYDFSICGGVFKTEDFISVGCLKPSLKIASVYEFLMRFVYNSKKIYVIPKIGCIHTYGRDGSYMVTSKNEISQKEGEWLINTAQQEIFFKEDRNKKFGE